MNEDDRVTELQVRMSEMLNENRMLRRQRDAVVTVLRASRVDLPVTIAHALLAGDDSDELAGVFRAASVADRELKALAERVLVLEHDAWVHTTGIARDFLAEVDARTRLGGPPVDPAEWAERFRTVLGR